MSEQSPSRLATAAEVQGLLAENVTIDEVMALLSLVRSGRASVAQSATNLPIDALTAASAGDVDPPLPSTGATPALLLGLSTAALPRAAPAAVATAASKLHGTASALTHSAEEAAQRIAWDLHEVCSLETQRARLGLGPLLLQPLPLATLETTVPEALPLLAGQLFEYEGDFSDFSQIIDMCVSADNQLRHILAVTQASGSGKTKLSFAEVR